MESLNPAATTIQAVVAAAGYALVALVALKAPRLVSPVAFSAASVIMILGGSFVWWWGMEASNAVVATVGVCVAHFGCSWPRILVGASLCALGNKRDLVLAAFLGEGIGALMRCLIPQTLSLVACLAVAGLAELVMTCAGHAVGVPFLKRGLSARSPEELGTTNPNSFVSPSHRLFILIAFFEFIHGISLAEKTDVILGANIAVVIALIAGGVWVFARHRMESEDILLVIAALLMLGGFILRPLTPVESMMSSTLSFAGAAFSWVLIWTVFASVGMSNPAGALWALGAGYTMQALGLGLARFWDAGPRLSGSQLRTAWRTASTPWWCSPSLGICSWACAGSPSARLLPISCPLSPCALWSIPLPTSSRAARPWRVSTACRPASST